MKKILFLFLVTCSSQAFAQKINQVFNTAFKSFASDSTFTHATISLYVINTTKGDTVTEVNPEIGVAPASCQKVITATTAFALLGHDYTYKTTLGYTGKIVNGVLNGNLILKGSGDPTLGSWRYSTANEESVIADFKNAVSRAGIHGITGHVFADESLWQSEATPDGWNWQDIGNYYGAGARALNWRENQYDLYLRSGKSIIIIVFSFYKTGIRNDAVDRSAFHFKSADSRKRIKKRRKPRLLSRIFHYRYQRFGSYTV